MDSLVQDSEQYYQCLLQVRLLQVDTNQVLQIFGSFSKS